jgi:photosystem II stability/assembly factor-like uncharacterized protein
MLHRLSILILLIIFSASKGLFSQGSWERIESPTDQWLRSVWFTDSLTGWAVGNEGVIIHTEDGGDSWSYQDSQTEDNIVDVFFLNSDTGWASSFNFTQAPYGTVLLKTTDGGETWTHQAYPEENIFINCILFLDPMNGWMGGRPHALVRTNNGGATWQQASIDTTTLAFFPVLKIEFYDENYGYACGGMLDIAGVIWRTWDGGNHWYAIDVLDAPADEVRGLHTKDSLNVIGAGGDPDFGFGVGIIHTDDGGLNWDYDEIGYQGNAYDLDFRSETEAWAPLGPRRKFIYSTDGGRKWLETYTPDSVVIFDVIFPDSMHGYAVGPDGAMLSYVPPEPVSVQEVPARDITFELQIYPNPSRGIINLQFTTYSLQSVSIKIYDLHGREVATILDKVMPQGEHVVRIDASRLPEGIYFCRMHVDDNTSVISKIEKIVVIN